MQSKGSTSIRRNWGASGFFTSSIQLSTGHSVTQIGDPPHPVQASLIVASIFGLRFLFSERLAFSATAIIYVLVPTTVVLINTHHPQREKTQIECDGLLAETSSVCNTSVIH